MVVVVLMAGRGTRTRSIQPGMPKPLLRIHGIPMVDWVLSSIKSIEACQFVFVVQKADSLQFDLSNYFKKFNIQFNLVELEGPNDGAAISALAAAPYYQQDELLIMNCDQFLNLDLRLFLKVARAAKSDGQILTMNATGPKWSYVSQDEQENVIQVAEKKEISNRATVGVYWFRSGADFIWGAQKMIEAGDRTNNEFYVAPVYNYLIKNSKKIRAVNIDELGATFFGLGTADDIQRFEDLPISLSLAKEIAIR